MSLKTNGNMGTVIKTHREKLKLSQREVSEHLGFKNGQFISNVERGMCPIPVYKFKDLAEVLKCSFNKIRYSFHFKL